MNKSDKQRKAGSGKGHGKGSKDQQSGVGDKVENYKTEICQSYRFYGFCEYEDNCQFAHGLDDLRPRDFGLQYKTERCKNYHGTSGGSQPSGYCPFQSRCKFLHDEKRVQVGDSEFWLISPSENLIRVEVVDNRARKEQLMKLVDAKIDREANQTMDISMLLSNLNLGPAFTGPFLEGQMPRFAYPPGDRRTQGSVDGKPAAPTPETRGSNKPSQSQGVVSYPQAMRVGVPPMPAMGGHGFAPDQFVGMPPPQMTPFPMQPIPVVPPPMPMVMPAPGMNGGSTNTPVYVNGMLYGPPLVAGVDPSQFAPNYGPSGVVYADGPYPPPPFEAYNGAMPPPQFPYGPPPVYHPGFQGPAQDSFHGGPQNAMGYAPNAEQMQQQQPQQPLNDTNQSDNPNYVQNMANDPYPQGEESTTNTTEETATHSPSQPLEGQ